MWFVYAWNTALLELFGITQEEAISLVGIHELEFVFHPDLSLRKNLPEAAWNEFASTQLAHFVADLDIPMRLDEVWLKNLIERLANYPNFSDLWNISINSPRDHLPENERLLNLTENNRKITFFISALNIDKYPRFNLIELILK
jgi:PAS domain-containing protein